MFYGRLISGSYLASGGSAGPVALWRYETVQRVGGIGVVAPIGEVVLTKKLCFAKKFDATSFYGTP